MLYAADFLAVGTAVEVANGYQIVFERNTFIAAVMVVAVMFCSFYMKHRQPCKTEIRVRIAFLTVAVICAFGFVVANPSKYTSSTPFANQYLSAFSVNVIQMHQLAPKNYSLDSVRNIIESNQKKEKRF